MNEFLFSAGNFTAMVGWALLIFLPRWRGLAQAAATVAVPVVLSVAYAALIGAWWSRGDGGFGSLAEVRSLFGTPGLLLAGWLHYLAFDLFVGAWVARECRRDGVPHGVVVPILVLTFLFGPIGYLASLTVRAAWRIGTINTEDRAAVPVARTLDAFVRREPRLMAAAVVCFAAMVPTALAWAIDGRAFEGMNVWIKPLKFEVSLGIYLATLAFFLPIASDAFRRSAAGRFIVLGPILAAAFELIYIAWRASRGEASHYNTATPVAAALYASMGVGALILAAAGPVLAWGVARSDARPVAPAYRLAIVLGLLLTFGLGVVGGAVMAASPGHFVGTAPPGARVVPLVGWSRAVGDLRVAHFLALHAQQVVAAMGAVAAAFFAGRAKAKAAVIAFAGLYALVAVGLFLQALAGHAFLPS